MAETEEKKPSFEQRLQAYTEEQVKKLRVNDSDLNEEFKTQAEGYVLASMKAAKAAQIVGMVKTELDETLSMIDIEIRSENQDKKPTEKQIESKIKADPRFKKAKEKLLQAEYQFEVYKSVAQSWVHKRDMLIQMGSLYRAELDSTISLKDNSKSGRSNGGKRAQFETL